MKVLVISIHPDDETLGCGATILKHIKGGDDVFWMIVTDYSLKSGHSKEAIAKRKKEIKDVFRAYGFKGLYHLGFATNRLHAVDFSNIIKKVLSVIQRVKPQVIYTVNRSDIHTDHQIAAKAIMSCTKSFRNPFIKRILAYECVSETEIAPPLAENVFIPNVYSDISGLLEKKIEIMKIYKSELQQAPFPRSVENLKALARFRGSAAYVPYAEAFMLLKDVF